jgi:4-amino-4-deoxy-L-arabinose transferase
VKSPSHAAFLCALGLCTFALLSLRMPVSSEIRYIESTREMVESGDWVLPHLGYVPYFEKPILLYWLGAASRLVLGDSLVAVRLPAILAGTLSLLVTWDLARRLLGERGGMQAALLLLASGFFLALNSILTTDSLFAACVWSALYAWWRARGEGGRLWKWAYCVATALGFMTKGPLALILVGGSIAAFLVFRERPGAGGIARAQAERVVRGLRAALVQGHVLQLVLVTAALNLPWTLAVLRRDPRMLEFFYVRENLKAFFDGSVHHTQPFYFYAPVLFAAFVPWSLPCALGLVVALRERILAAWRGPAREAPAGGTAELRGYLGAIALFTLAFLQLSSAKLGSYPLPILPALAILVVDCWRARLSAPPRWLRVSLLAGSLLTIAGVALYASGRFEEVATLPRQPVQHLAVCLVLVALALLAGGVLALRGRFWGGIATCGAAFAVLVAIGMARLEDLRLERNVQSLAREIARRAEPGDLIVASGSFVHDYTLQLTLQRRVGFLGRTRELGMGHFAEMTPPSVPIPDDPYGVQAENLESPWLFTRERLATALNGKRRVWFVGSPKDVDALAGEGQALQVVASLPNARLCTNPD